jgi:hypothetical protein
MIRANFLTLKKMKVAGSLDTQKFHVYRVSIKEKLWRIRPGVVYVHRSARHRRPAERLLICTVKFFKSPVFFYCLP